MNDTWEYDGVDWSPISTIESPTVRANAATVFDTARGEILLFGGVDANGLTLNETWEYDGVNWEQRTLAASPPSREGHAMAFDTARAKTVMFGGATRSSSLSDTWEYDGVTQPSLDGIRSPGADPDCNGRCYPLCPLTTPVAQCRAADTHCGDLVCNAPLEDYLLCPVDCPAP